MGGPRCPPALCTTLLARRPMTTSRPSIETVPSTSTWGRSHTIGAVWSVGVARSSRQSCNPAGGSPAVSIVRVGHEAMPHPGAGNQPGDAWCKRPGRPARRCAAVGAAWRSSECGGLNGNGMATAPKSRYLVAAAVRGGLVRRAHSRGAKTGVSKEGTDKRTWRAPRGRGPSTHTRIAGNNVGKDHLPAGAGRNLRRPVV